MPSFMEVLKQVDTTSGSWCWLWPGTIDRDGYGRHNAQFAHRLVYELHRGAIPVGHSIDHICHNQDLECRGGPTCSHRRCVNPGHLRAVTPGVNSADARQGVRSSVGDDVALWQRFGEVAPPRGRMKVMRQLMRWYIGESAELPPRPADSQQNET